MAHDTLSITYEDYKGRSGTFQIPVEAGLGIASAFLIDFVQQCTDASLCVVTGVTLTQAFPMPSTNPVAEEDIGNDSVEEQVAMQAKRTDNGGYTRFSIPGPRDLLFDPTGPYAGADVLPGEATLAAPLIASANLVWKAPAGLAVAFDKGWRKGRKHS